MEYQHSWQVGPQEEGPDYVTPIILSCLGSKTEAVTKIGPGEYVYIYIWMFPKIVVPPNHPILIGFSIINHPFWGTPILGNIHIWLYLGGGFHHFFFSPRTLGRSSNLTNIFSNGLKPPIRYIGYEILPSCIGMLIFQKPQERSLEVWNQWNFMVTPQSFHKNHKT